jgi:peroxiredoxin
MRKWALVIALVGVAVGVVLVLRRPMAQASPEAPAEVRTTAPEFAQGTAWLQSDPLTMASLRGQVVVVHFWTFGCINCVHNYPVYKAWQRKYAGKGVTIVGIHTPEFKREADVKQIRAQAERHGLNFPIALDHDERNWKAWNNRYWPSIYLIDKKGQVRYRWEGELHLDSVEGRQFSSRIDELQAEQVDRKKSD